KTILWNKLVVIITQITLKIHQHPIKTTMGMFVFPTPLKIPQMTCESVKNKYPGAKQRIIIKPYSITLGFDEKICNKYGAEKTTNTLNTRIVPQLIKVPIL